MDADEVGTIVVYILLILLVISAIFGLGITCGKNQICDESCIKKEFDEGFYADKECKCKKIEKLTEETIKE